MYVLFGKFKLCFNIAISFILFSDVTKDLTRPGNKSVALSCQSPTQAPKEDQIHYAMERLDDTALEQRIAGNLLY